MDEGGEGEDTRADRGLSPRCADAPPAVDQAGDNDRAAGLIAAGLGRRRLARELNITEYRAGQLLAASRNGSAVAR